MTDSQLSYLDGYCERAGMAGFWAEPLNAVTNLAFILAAVMAIAYYRKTPIALKKSLEVPFLIFILIAIGIGSGAWHTLATKSAMLGDVIPIALFIHIYMVTFLIRIMRFRLLPAVAFWLGFLGFSFAVEYFLPNDLLNGTLMYIPTYLVLLLFLGILARRGHEARKPLQTVIAIWTFSLIFRTIDIEICPTFHTGTHFLWHVLNAVVLYRLLVLLLKFGHYSAGSKVK